MLNRVRGTGSQRHVQAVAYLFRKSRMGRAAENHDIVHVAISVRDPIQLLAFSSIFAWSHCKSRDTDSPCQVEYPAVHGEDAITTTCLEAVSLSSVGSICSTYRMYGPTGRLRPC